MRMKILLLCFSAVIGFTACYTSKPSTHKLPIPEDSYTVPIDRQLKTSYRFDGVYVDNQFDGARMNGFMQVNDSTFRVIVSPENTPINASSYFAFRMRSERQRSIDLEINYTEHEHRYVPKLSRDGKSWVPMDTTQFDTLKAGNLVSLQLDIDSSYLFVAAQEVLPSSDSYNWVDSLSGIHSFVRKEIIGTSLDGREIPFFEISEGEVRKNPAIAVFGRIHPPELTGYLAMKAFVETLLDTSQLAKAFRRNYRIMVYPIINPDGVDMGHWRHNAGGVDLNRDWSHYRQKEPRLVAYHLKKELSKQRNSLVLGLDFHSTQEDVYYTLTENRVSHIHGFKDLWIEAIDRAFEDYVPNDEPYDLNQPITKTWFYLEFGAEGITYEVGDETDRDFVKNKAQVAAVEMMKLLVLK